MPPKKHDTKVGDKFGRLTVIGEIIKKGKHRHVPCLCVCGETTEPRIGELFSRDTKSCGCLKTEIIVKANFKHGLSKKKIHRTWLDMRYRCFDQKNLAYKYYGGRGITVCKEWLKFLPFYEWAMSHGYQEGLTIERKNNGLGYSPDNCIFIPKSKQSSNRRCCPSIKIDGKLFSTLKAATRHFGIGYCTVRRRLKIGWGLEKALKTPLQNRIQVKISGKSFPSFAAAARYFGISYETTYRRFRRGASIEVAFGV